MTYSVILSGYHSVQKTENVVHRRAEKEKKQLLKRLRTFCDTETNIMLVGATGCGKSSTINALFACGEEQPEDEDPENADGAERVGRRCVAEVAKVGSKSDPEREDRVARKKDQGGFRVGRAAGLLLRRVQRGVRGCGLSLQSVQAALLYYGGDARTEAHCGYGEHQHRRRQL